MALSNLLFQMIDIVEPIQHVINLCRAKNSSKSIWPGTVSDGLDVDQVFGFGGDDVNHFGRKFTYL